jgi:hypothetical protein
MLVLINRICDTLTYVHSEENAANQLAPPQISSPTCIPLAYSACTAVGNRYPGRTGNLSAILHERQSMAHKRFKPGRPTISGIAPVSIEASLVNLFMSGVSSLHACSEQWSATFTVLHSNPTHQATDWDYSIIIVTHGPASSVVSIIFSHAQSLAAVVNALLRV